MCLCLKSSRFRHLLQALVDQVTMCPIKSRHNVTFPPVGFLLAAAGVAVPLRIFAAPSAGDNLSAHDTA